MKIGKSFKQTWLVVVFFVSVGFAAVLSVFSADSKTFFSTPDDGTVRLDSWEYAWGDAESGWGERPGGDWRPAASLLNPDGRDSSRIVWFRTRLPAEIGCDPHLLLQANQLFEVYSGKELLFSHGIINSEGRSHYIGTPPRIKPLGEEAGGEMLYVRVYSDGKDIGFLRPPVIGSRADLYMTFIEKQSVRFLLGCFYMLIGLIALYPYFRLKQDHLLFFSGFTVAFGAYTVIRTTLIYLIWDQPAFWMVLELAALMLSLAAIGAFIKQLFGAGYLNHLDLLWKAHLLYGAVTIPLSMARVVQVTDVLRVYQIFILASMVLVVGRIGRIAYGGDRDAKVMLIGMAVFSACGTWDIVRQIFMVESALPELAYWGLFIFLISLIIVIIRRLFHMLVRLANSEKLSLAGQLAAGVAHEIRNPITVISGYLQLMKKGSGNQQTIEIMQGEVNRIQLIMNEFLFLSKPAMPKYAERRIEDMVREVFRLFEAQAESAGVKVGFHFPSKLASISCDDNQLKQVLVNVFKNALEAMPNGGDLSIAVSEKAGWMTLEVTDTGSGIAESKLARIGEPFFTTKENGNGLGIMICRSIVDNHGGRFTIKSREGIGTAVEIILPLKKL